MSYFIDVQGTLISDFDKSALNGSCEFIDYLNKTNTPYVVVTNNTKIPSNEFLDFLRQSGLNIKDGSYLDPFCVLKSIINPCNAACFGAKEFISSMQKIGFVMDYENPKAVFVASYDDFKFGDFADMIELILNGSKLILMHQTSIYKKKGRRFPGVGAIGEMLKYATSCTFDVVGKPSEIFYKNALKLLQNQKSDIKFSDVIMISDDAKGDLVVAKEFGINTVLVRSGKVSDISEIKPFAEKIDTIFDDIGAYFKRVLDEND